MLSYIVCFRHIVRCRVATEMAENLAEGTSSCVGAPLKRKRRFQYDCILLCGKACFSDESLGNITLDKSKSMQDKASKWKGPATFGTVHCSVNWEKWPKGHCMHNHCYTSLSSNDKLRRAQRHQCKAVESLQDPAQISDQKMGATAEAGAPKKLRSITGRLYDKSICVWCMKG